MKNLLFVTAIMALSVPARADVFFHMNLEGDHLNDIEDPTNNIKDNVEVFLRIEGIDQLTDIIDGSDYTFSYSADYTSGDPALDDLTESGSGTATANVGFQNGGDYDIEFHSDIAHSLPDLFGFTGNISFNLYNFGTNNGGGWSASPLNYGIRGTGEFVTEISEETFFAATGSSAGGNAPLASGLIGMILALGASVFGVRFRRK